MTTLIIDQTDAALRVSRDVVELRREGHALRRMPPKQLERVVMHGDVSLTSGSLARLAEAQVSVVCIGARPSRVAMLVGAGHGDALRRIKQHEVCSDQRFCQHVAKQWVKAKIKGHAMFLQRALRQHPQHRARLFSVQQGLVNTQTKLDMVTTLPLERLRGFEGAAAARFFSAYKLLFAPNLEFNQRQRHPSPDPVNAVLSLAYTLLHSEFIKALHMVGLDPFVGVYHAPSHGHAALSSDVMESCRPYIDEWVQVCFAKRVLRLDHFHFDANQCVLGKAGRSIFYAEIDALMRPLRRLLRLKARALLADIVRWNSSDPHLFSILSADNSEEQFDGFGVTPESDLDLTA